MLLCPAPSSKIVPQSAKHNEYSSFSKREGPRKLFTLRTSTCTLRSRLTMLQSAKRHNESAKHSKNTIRECPNSQNGTMNMQNTVPESAKHNEYSSFSKRESPRKLFTLCTSTLRSRLLQIAKRHNESAKLH